MNSAQCCRLVLLFVLYNPFSLIPHSAFIASRELVYQQKASSRLSQLHFRIALLSSISSTISTLDIFLILYLLIAIKITYFEPPISLLTYNPDAALHNVILMRAGHFHITRKSKGPPFLSILTVHSSFDTARPKFSFQIRFHYELQCYW